MGLISFRQDTCSHHDLFRTGKGFVSKETFLRGRPVGNPVFLRLFQDVIQYQHWNDHEGEKREDEVRHDGKVRKGLFRGNPFRCGIGQYISPCLLNSCHYLCLMSTIINWLKMSIFINNLKHGFQGEMRKKWHMILLLLTFR